MSKAAIFTLLLVAGAGLGAQEVRFGLQGNLAFPQGDSISSVGTGWGLGAHATFAFGKHALRPRFDALFFPEQSHGYSWVPGEILKTSVKDRTLSLGLDYLYFTGGQDKGLYLLAGASAIRGITDVKVEYSSGATRRSSTYSNDLGVTAGFGYQWTRTFGTEIKYHAFDPKKDTIQVGATARF